MALHVITEDTETGAVGEHTIEGSDYLLILHGACEVTSVVVHSNGTHQLVIKGHGHG
jgi:hypothetical protein